MPFNEGRDPDGNPIATGFDENTGAASGPVTSRAATGGVPTASSGTLVGDGPSVEEMRSYSREHLEEMGKRTLANDADPLTAATEAIKANAQERADAIIAGADAAIEQLKLTVGEDGKNLADLYAYLRTQSADTHGKSTDPATLANEMFSGIDDPDTNLHMRHTEDEKKWAEEGISTESPVRSLDEMKDGGDNTPQFEDHTDVQKVELVNEDGEPADGSYTPASDDDTVPYDPYHPGGIESDPPSDGGTVDPNNPDVSKDA